MKIGTKLIAGFVIVALLAVFSSLFSLYQMNEIAQPINEDIPASSDELSKISHLDSLAQFIRYYDEVLTQSARNYAFTQDRKWEKRYRDIEPELDNVIKEAIDKGDEEDKQFFSSVDQANLALVALEYEAIQLVNEGKSDEAQEILESNEYWDQKAIYEQGLRAYVLKRGVSYNQALRSSSEIVEVTVERTSRIITQSRQLMITFLLAVLVLTVVFALIILRTVSRPLRELTNVIEAISTGKIEATISPKLKESNDELGTLAKAFDRTIVSLKLAMHGSKNSMKKRGGSS